MKNIVTAFLFFWAPEFGCLSYQYQIPAGYIAAINWCIRVLLMLRFPNTIKIRVLIANLVEIHCYDASKRLQTLY